ncbi:MAG: SMP-30/gluconolactonase/LRE family protein [Candidatus Cloacimonetes bacterium]|nr:SMP-30/gluconolactonase/LRE family protein [Candidatus Cloacimonadota bacterium]
MKFIIFLLVSVCTFVNLSGQLLNNPESVEWDHINQQWLVSNHGSGEIIAIDSENNQTIFSDILSSTRGLKVKDDKLYAASDDGLAIFDLAGAYLIAIVFIPEAVLLNDLDFDSEGNLFVSDYWDNNIFKVDVENYTYEWLIDYDIFAPNGLIFDEENNRMIAAAHNQTTSVILGINVETAETEVLLYPNIYSLDGFARDSAGNIYVSSWHTDSIYRFDGNNINSNTELVVSNVEDPADIFIRQSDDVLAIPLFYENIVLFIPLDVASENENTIEKPLVTNFSSYPNPFKLNSERNSNISFSFDLSSEIKNSIIEIYNMKGQKIKSIQISKKESVDKISAWDCKTDFGEKVSSGIYLSVLKSKNEIIASNKILLMKD